MAKIAWIRPETEPSEGGMVSFRRGLLAMLGIFTFQGAWLLVPWATADNSPTILGVSPIGACLALGIGTLIAQRHWPRITSGAYAGLALVIAVTSVLAYRRPETLCLFGIPVLVGGLLLGRRASIILGGASIVALWYVAAQAGLPKPLFAIVMMMLLTAIVAMAGHFALQVDYWERALVSHQREYIHELRDRQGELNRALKALDEAYASLKRSNEELRIARQMADEARTLKDQFVANVSHELRTPLNLITGFAEMMYLSPEIYQGVVWTETLEGDIEEVYRASRHLTGLVNDILDLSRIDASRLPMFREMADVRSIIRDACDTVHPLIKQHDLAVRVEMPEDVPSLFVDRTRIRQVLLNLLNNAVRYTDQGAVEVRVIPQETAVEIQVNDTGMGVPPDQLETVFEQFRQADPGLRGRGGAGLGLALSRQFVHLHGGRMWVQSAVGEGSSFRFALPLPGANPQYTDLVNIPQETKRSTDRAPVLVVDPDPSIGDMLRRYLGDRPVICLSTAHEVPAAVKEHHPLAVVVNLDPGASTADWLGSLDDTTDRFAVPILRCSIPSPSWLRAAMGFDQVITKPISRESLQELRQHQRSSAGCALIVDDDPGFVRLVQRMLPLAGWHGNIAAAYSGDHALRLARSDPPDVILLDVLMPDMDGFAVLQALRSDPALSETWVAAVTASSYAEEALMRKSNHWTLTQSSGLSSGTIADLLNVTLPLVRPDYLGEEHTDPRMSPAD